MKKIDRRQFLKTGIKAGVALGSLTVVPKLLANETLSDENLPDISVASGTDYYNTTMRAIEQIGGIERFIQKKDTVGILANSGYGKPGTYTRPDVFLAVAHLCFEVGERLDDEPGPNEEEIRPVLKGLEKKKLVKRVGPNSGEEKYMVSEK